MHAGELLRGDPDVRASNVNAPHDKIVARAMAASVSPLNLPKTALQLKHGNCSTPSPYGTP